MVFYIQLFQLKRLVHKECSMKERYNTSKHFKQRKKLLWNLKSHATSIKL